MINVSITAFAHKMSVEIIEQRQDSEEKYIGIAYWLVLIAAEI